jgi:pseudouridine kinase
MPEKKVLVIGASIIDLTGSPDNELVYGDSCNGKIHISHGGVGRNIAENLKRLGIPTDLMTALGNDLFGKKIQFDSHNIGINLHSSIIDDNLATSVYLLVNNHVGDIEFGISDTDVIKLVDKKYIEQHKKYISGFDTIVLDTNLPKESIFYLSETFGDKHLFLDLVTRQKSQKVKDIIGRFYGIKPNIGEAEELTGIKFEQQDDLLRMRDYFLNAGVKKMYITMSKKGSFYADSEMCGFVNASSVKPKSTSGAGDSYTAGVVFSYLNGKSTAESAVFGTGAAIASLLHGSASNPKLSENLINEIITKYTICSQNI